MTNHLFALGPPDGARFTWAPSPLLLTHANTLQGGAGLGAATTAMETVAGRPVVWATAQYLSFAFGDEPIDIDVTIEVAGHKTTQARCVVSRHRTEILTAHAALGRRDIDFEGVWCAPPDVPEPDDCPPYPFSSGGEDISAISSSSDWRVGGNSTRSMRDRAGATVRSHSGSGAGAATT